MQLQRNKKIKEACFIAGVITNAVATCQGTLIRKGVPTISLQELSQMQLQRRENGVRELEIKAFHWFHCRSYHKCNCNKEMGEILFSDNIVSLQELSQMQLQQLYKTVKA